MMMTTTTTMMTWTPYIGRRVPDPIWHMFQSFLRNHHLCDIQSIRPSIAKEEGRGDDLTTTTTTEI
jgi:hypothetical protein